LVSIDNVSSLQMGQIRLTLRKKGFDEPVLLMGKNTILKKVLRGVVEEIPELGVLLKKISGNIGIAFTNGDLKILKDTILENKVTASAREGAVSQCDVKIQAGSTNLVPDKTSFFQALSIPTKITKGCIEILSEVLVLKKDEKVNASTAELLSMLGVRPFSYGMGIVSVYDNGSIYDPAILDITEEDILKFYSSSLFRISALCLSLGYLTIASVPTMLISGFKKSPRNFQLY